MSLKDCVSKQIVLLNVLRKNFDILYNHACLPLTSKQINLLLLSQISWYFFVCYSLLNLCFQNRYRLEFTWWLPLQFEHLKEWRHSFPCFVSSLGEFVLKFTLQHQANWWWCSLLCSPLHLVHLEPWILHTKILCSHFQQFLYWRTSEFIFAPQIVAMCFPTLKHLLIIILPFFSLWVSQISIQIIAISNLGKVFITLLWYGLDDIVELIDTSLHEFFELSGIFPLVETITIFTKSLIGTTMQDSGTRERSDLDFLVICLFINHRIKM